MKQHFNHTQYIYLDLDLSLKFCSYLDTLKVSILKLLYYIIVFVEYLFSVINFYFYTYDKHKFLAVKLGTSHIENINISADIFSGVAFFKNIIAAAIRHSTFI